MTSYTIIVENEFKIHMFNIIDVKDMKYERQKQIWRKSRKWKTKVNLEKIKKVNVFMDIILIIF